MTPAKHVKIAIVDYGLGNLYSVRRACEHAGMNAFLTERPSDLLNADGVILPGVGAFGDAMAALNRSGMSQTLRDTVASGKPLLGICLGIQLLMNQSEEFGRHAGLGLVPGTVVRLNGQREGERALKVPQICWNGIYRPRHSSGFREDLWSRTPLEGIRDGESMYFVHSYFVQPADPTVILSLTRFGQVEFCSSLRSGNVFACQFHPERSGPQGLQIYRGFSDWIRLTAH